MIDEDNRLYGNAAAHASEITLGIWPWVSKRKAWKRCKVTLKEYRDAIFAEERKELDKKGKKLHTYTVTIGYEKFPYYYDVKQKGDWFWFCDGFKVVTIRHKDERFDHTVHYKDVTIEATSPDNAKKRIEHNSKYHICSFEFEEV